ncbi:uncharacterized protein CTRU02_203638 [Colletotrichum truncatum]|uniref:Uncharacterized protein n=1 Tax=Colletotrichum truncatum TaxID=5467 RepID=A0ACC3ZA41_COLTU
MTSHAQDYGYSHGYRLCRNGYFREWCMHIALLPSTTATTTRPPALKQQQRQKQRPNCTHRYRHLM